MERPTNKASRWHAKTRRASGVVRRRRARHGSSQFAINFLKRERFL